MFEYMLHTNYYKALEAQSGREQGGKQGNLTSTVTSTFAFMAGVTSLLDTEGVDCSQQTRAPTVC